MFLCTPFSFDFWKNGGRYPALPTANIPFEGPETHVSTLASTPKARATAITGESQLAFRYAKYLSKPIRRLWVRLISF